MREREGRDGVLAVSREGWRQSIEKFYFTDLGLEILQRNASDDSPVHCCCPSPIRHCGTTLKHTIVLPARAVCAAFIEGRVV